MISFRSFIIRAVAMIVIMRKMLSFFLFLMLR